jgi:hypothetical protein
MVKPLFSKKINVFHGLAMLGAALSLMLLRPSPSRAQIIPQTTGLFAINATGNFRSKTNASMLTNPSIRGIFVSMNWNVLEATEGSYYWSSLDSMLSQAGAAGKQVTLGVMAGYETPSWVYADGAQSFQFLWDKTGGASGAATCSVQSLPVPWDPVFLAKWATFIQALGARYSANPTLVSVMLYGVNFESVETSLPVSNGEKIQGEGKSCTGYNYPALWQAAGYTRVKVEDALELLQTFYQGAFPNTQLLAGLNPHGFPPINQAGNLIAKQTADFQVPSDLIANGAATLGSQYSAGDGGLSATGWTWSTLTDYASTLDTGYQTTTALGSALPAAMDMAIAAGSQWLQLYSSDVTLSSNQSALASAAQQLH